MDVVVTLGIDEGWCMRCGRCRLLDRTGRCLDCSYMARGRQPDAIEEALAEIEAARELAGEAGLTAVYAALVKAQLALGYLGQELRSPRSGCEWVTDYPRAS